MRLVQAEPTRLEMSKQTLDSPAFAAFRQSLLYREVGGDNDTNPPLPSHQVEVTLERDLNLMHKPPDSRRPVHAAAGGTPVACRAPLAVPQRFPFCPPRARFFGLSEPSTIPIMNTTLEVPLSLYSILFPPPRRPSPWAAVPFQRYLSSGSNISRAPRTRSRGFILRGRLEGGISQF